MPIDLSEVKEAIMDAAKELIEERNQLPTFYMGMGNVFIGKPNLDQIRMVIVGQIVRYYGLR
jgi:hypothetical protein